VCVTKHNLFVFVTMEEWLQDAKLRPYLVYILSEHSVILVCVFNLYTQTFF